MVLLKMLNHIKDVISQWSLNSKAKFISMQSAYDVDWLVKYVWNENAYTLWDEY